MRVPKNRITPPESASDGESGRCGKCWPLTTVSKGATRIELVIHPDYLLGAPTNKRGLTDREAESQVKEIVK